MTWNEFENSQKIKHLLGIFGESPNVEDLIFIIKKWWYFEGGKQYMQALKTISLGDSICFVHRDVIRWSTAMWPNQDFSHLTKSDHFQCIKKTDKESYYIIKK